MNLPRRVVLSRKGFDGGTGFIPSPILDDGTMLSLPIPDSAGTVRYEDLSFHEHSYGKIISDLGAKRNSKDNSRLPLLPSDKAHLDPDLIKELCDRPSGWKPAYGQCGTAASILRNNNINKGDLFIFFGWFKRCTFRNGHYRFIRRASDIHVIFGYLRIGEIINLSFQAAPEWAKNHPHLHGTHRKDDFGNTLFIESDHLGLPGLMKAPGAKAFTHFDRKLQLTAPGKSRSWWRLPKWFYPDLKKPVLSSHDKLSRWILEDESCLLQSVPRGQEFVLDLKCYPEAIKWIEDILG